MSEKTYEEQVFGAQWERATCTMDQAAEYFSLRFGLTSRAAFYSILHPYLEKRPLAPENAHRRHFIVGYVLFASDVVAACDKIEQQARAA